jgi:hypothetical protein
MTADKPTAPRSEDPDRHSRLMIGLRYVLPGAIVLAGAIVMAMGGEADLEGGAGIVSAGLAVYLLSWMYRVSAYGDGAREEEQAARDYLSAHGHWPDEAPGRASAEGRSTRS